MNKKTSSFPLVSLILFVGFAAAAGSVFYRIQNPKPAQAPAVAPLPVLGKVPNFQLTERSGAPKTLADLNGKVWIADFIFTRCAGICPLMTRKMSKVQKELAAEPRVSFVSFSVDPEHDTPEVLKEYAQKYEADPERWLFLTGDKKQIFDLSSQHFHLGVGDIPEAEQETPENSMQVQHSSKFVLVDAQGQIRGYYSSEEESSLEALAGDARKLASE